MPVCVSSLAIVLGGRGWRPGRERCASRRFLSGELSPGDWALSRRPAGEGDVRGLTWGGLRPTFSSVPAVSEAWGTPGAGGCAVGCQRTAAIPRHEEGDREVCNEWSMP